MKLCSVFSGLVGILWSPQFQAQCAKVPAGLRVFALGRPFGESLPAATICEHLQCAQFKLLSYNSKCQTVMKCGSCQVGANSPAEWCSQANPYPNSWALNDAWVDTTDKIIGGGFGKFFSKDKHGMSFAPNWNFDQAMSIERCGPEPDKPPINPSSGISKSVVLTVTISKTAPTHMNKGMSIEIFFNGQKGHAFQHGAFCRRNKMSYDLRKLNLQNGETAVILYRVSVPYDLNSLSQNDFSVNLVCHDIQCDMTKYQLCLHFHCRDGLNQLAMWKSYGSLVTAGLPLLPTTEQDFVLEPELQEELATLIAEGANALASPTAVAG